MDDDVAYDVVDSLIRWIVCMLREIELTTLSGCIYISYIDNAIDHLIPYHDTLSQYALLETVRASSAWVVVTTGGQTFNPLAQYR